MLHEAKLLIQINTRYADERISLPPMLRFAQFANVRNLGIKMPWQEIEANSLAQVKKLRQRLLEEFFHEIPRSNCISNGACFKIGAEDS